MKIDPFDLLTACALLGALWVCTQAELPDKYQPKHLVADYVQPLPAGDYNYRSAQLSLQQLEDLLASGGIETVVRLNGNGRDAGGVPVAREAELCARYDVQFIRINIDGGRRDRQLERIANLLDNGRTLVHCRHGYDRTGAAVGYWLRRLGFSAQQVIHHNQWEDYLQKKGGAYRKYYEVVQ